jgi:hypothetical protein
LHVQETREVARSALVVLLSCCSIWTAVPAALAETALTDKPSSLGDTYDLPGLRLDTYTIHGSMGVSAVANGKEDFELHQAPSLNLSRKSSRTVLSASARGDFGIAATTGELGDATADADVKIVSALSDSTLVEVEAGYSFEHEMLPDLLNHDEDPKHEHRIAANLGLVQNIGDFALRFDAGGELVLFEDVGGVDKSHSNYIEPVAALRLTYRLTPEFRPFAEIAYVPRRFLRDFDSKGFRRHVEGVELIGGVEIKAPPEWSGEIGIIWLENHYEEDFAETVGIAGLNVDLTWKPSEETEVLFAAATFIDRSTAGVIQGNPIYDNYIELNHALVDDLRLKAAIEVEYEDEEGNGGDLTVTPELGLAWQFHPNIAWTAAAQTEWLFAQDSADDDMDWAVSMGMEFRM